jgi:hypothetical protein
MAKNGQDGCTKVIYKGTFISKLSLSLENMIVVDIHGLIL